MHATLEWMHVLGESSLSFTTKQEMYKKKWVCVEYCRTNKIQAYTHVIFGDMVQLIISK